MISHLKETIVTLIPSIGGLYAALETTNIALKLVIGGMTVIYMWIKIKKASKEK